MRPDRVGDIRTGADEGLLAEMGRGDGDAFDALSQRHAAAVRRIGLALLGDPDRADELVRDTFDALRRSALGSPLPGDALRPRLMRIACELAADRLDEESAPPT